MSVKNYNPFSNIKVKYYEGPECANSVEGLKTKIEAIEDDAKLVDPNSKASRCMDVPSNSIVVNKGGKDITIYLRASCHTSKVENYNAEDIAYLIQGLAKL